MPGISRLGFFKAAAPAAVAATGAGALARAAFGSSSGGPPPVPQFYGIVTGRRDDGGLLVRPPHTGPRTTPVWILNVSPGASVVHLDESTLDAFQAGEEVIAFGAWSSSSTFEATRVEAMLSALSTRVSGRTATELETSAGRLDLSRAKPGQPALAQARAGDAVRALVLENVDSGHRSVALLEVG
jgi:hypothetical protein